MKSVLPLAACLLFVGSNGHFWSPRPGADTPLSLMWLRHPSQGPDILQSQMAARPSPNWVSAGSMGCGRRIGQGCAHSVLGNMDCGHGTYADQCNICQCARARTKSAAALGASSAGAAQTSSASPKTSPSFSANASHTHG
ncbi:uncharacterized protein [Penaeus vannamei]